MSCFTLSLRRARIEVMYFRKWVNLSTFTVCGTLCFLAYMYFWASRGANDVNSSPPKKLPSAQGITPCTKADIRRRSGTVMLTTTNAAFIDITENMLETVRRTRACPNITVIAEDEQSFQHLTRKAKTYPGLNVLKTTSGMLSSNHLKFNSDTYNRFVGKRPRYVVQFLEKGFDVLFVDADTVWFENPFRDFDGDFDMAMTNEDTAPRYIYCDGFAFYRCTENTLSLVREWAHLMETTHKTILDQYVLNDLIAADVVRGLKIKELNAAYYPDGYRYFLTRGWRERNNNTVVLHMTYILGHEAKVAKLKEYGWWVVS